MSYQCLVCSYKGRHFPGGACPGCGSFNVRKLDNPEQPSKPVARKPYRLMLAVALWFYLLVEIWKVLSR
ncbi:MAG: hypothetical protein M0Q95_13315 [Porticoccaceae bacterium]|nr:hypothetical protein [Porticoccaceae bacterium]